MPVPRRSLPLLVVAALSLAACGSGAASPDAAATATDTSGPMGDAAITDATATDPGARPSAGCTAPTGRYTAGSQSGQILAGGRQRTFVVHVPSGADPRRPAPVVVLLHGGLGTGAQLEGSALFSPIADREGVVAVYPDGVSRSWNAGRCCGPPAEQNLDDVGFIAALLDHLEGALCLDRRRVYATGMSNGAMMSHRLACALADRFAAIAPVSGVDMTDACTPARPVPVMMIHGSDDQHVPWKGGDGCGIAGVPFTSVPGSISAWLARNGCTPAAPTLLVAQGDGRCEQQGRCPPGADVVLCTIAGGGHSWPGGDEKPGELPACARAGEGGQSRTFLASEQLWAFFKAHALP